MTWLVLIIMGLTAHTADEPLFEGRGAIARLFACEAEEVLVEGPAGTGKSRGILECIHHRMEEYPGSRALFARKVRKTLADSILVTWEDEVLPPGHECLDGIKRAGRHQPYTYANGSTVTLLGFDDREKIKSTQFDVIYVNEGTEISRVDWDYAMSRLRGHAMPFKQGIIDCNPGAPAHWLNKRPKRPRLDENGQPLRDAAGQPVPMMLRMITRHRDNAAMWDRDKKAWTAYGRTYMARLQNLSGTERARLLLGEWVAQEGAVFEAYFDAARHCVAPPSHIVGGALVTGRTTTLASTLRYVVTVDWGFRAAGCIQVWAIDSDRRMYRVREIYAKHRLPAWWLAQARWVQRYYADPVFTCDPEDAAELESWRKAGLRVKAAQKLPGSIVAGIQRIKDRLTPLDGIAGMDGRPLPTLFLCKNAVGHYDDKGAFVACVDQALLNDDAACSTEDEMTLYCYEKDQEGKPIKEKPIDDNNHGVDCMRYAVLEVDGRPSLGEERLTPIDAPEGW